MGEERQPHLLGSSHGGGAGLPAEGASQSHPELHLDPGTQLGPTCQEGSRLGGQGQPPLQRGCHECQRLTPRVMGPLQILPRPDPRLLCPLPEPPPPLHPTGEETPQRGRIGPALAVLVLAPAGGLVCPLPQQMSSSKGGSVQTSGGGRWDQPPPKTSLWAEGLTDTLARPPH